jgi:hypothetical protein
MHRSSTQAIEFFRMPEQQHVIVLATQVEL